MTGNITQESVTPLLPPRPMDAHKGAFGHLFILAGARGYTGAAKLACLAASRAGVGLLTLGTPFPLADIFAIALTETMTLRLPSTEWETFSHDAVEPALEFAEDKQAAVLGPGLTRHAETVAFVQDFAVRCPIPLLIDADGLNALSDNPALLCERRAPALLTPHPGEMARLLHCSTAEIQTDREAAAQRLARDTQTVAVLKGRNTIIAAPDGRCAVNTTGNHGLAKGGTGDVLSGILGALMAQGLAPYEAACLGVWIHGRAGDLAAANRTPRGMIAGDVIDALPEVWRELEG